MKNIQTSHNRYNPLLDEWILVTSHPRRMNRPWSGKINKKDNKVADNMSNPLLPGAIRANGKHNDIYELTYVFDNDFPSLLPVETDNIDDSMSVYSFHINKDNDLFKWYPVNGNCKVMCYSSNSKITLALMDANDIKKVILKWIELLNELGKLYNWVQIFENKGDIMGASNPHPHCQIWASSFLPNIAVKEDANQLKYFMEHGTSLLTDYLAQELVKEERIVDVNDSWVILVPFWAVWPFETMVLPRRTDVYRFTDLINPEIEDLSDILKKLLTRYDNLFECSFPYSMGWHGAPTGQYVGQNMKYWLLHGSFYPPLLRSANIQKFMVGYELLAQPQRDLSPEQAAEMLRNVSNSIHYTQSDANLPITKENEEK